MGIGNLLFCHSINIISTEQFVVLLRFRPHMPSELMVYL